MNFVSILLIGLAMSTDAFAAAVGKGAAMRRPGFMQALRVGLIFGVIETLTPIVGWLLGHGASDWVEGWDHWIALALLSALGVHMIVAGLKPSDPGNIPNRPHGFWGLALTGVATSIDALAIGIGLAFLDVNILVVAATIGACTVVMVTAGVMLGHAVGTIVGKRAEIAGGFILILVGAAIAYQHVTGATGAVTA